MKLHKKLIFIICLLLVAVGSLGTLNARGSTWTTTLAELDLTFVETYYADLDNDGYEDDILLDLYVELLTFSYWDTIFGKNMELYVELELPSGAYHDYGFEITAYQPTFNIVLECYDHATESGDYTAHAIGFVEGNSYGLYHWVVFDPPGGSKPVPPSMYYYCY